MRATKPRTAEQVGAEITFQREAFLDADLAGDDAHAKEHYARMDELLDEYSLIPHQRHS